MIRFYCVKTNKMKRSSLFSWSMNTGLTKEPTLCFIVSQYSASSKTEELFASLCFSASLTYFRHFSGNRTFFLRTYRPAFYRIIADEAQCQMFSEQEDENKKYKVSPKTWLLFCDCCIRFKPLVLRSGGRSLFLSWAGVSSLGARSVAVAVSPPSLALMDEQSSVTWSPPSIPE